MSEVKQLYQQAFSAFAEGDYARAISLYQKVLEADPGFALGYQGLAEAYGRSDQLDRAIESIREAIRLEPEESLYHTSLSRFLQRQGRIPEAEEAAAIASQLQQRGL
ncbi:MAG: tetratricopeptide repeat protein [Myxococcota bacterium]